MADDPPERDAQQINTDFFKGCLAMPLAIVGVLIVVVLLIVFVGSLGGSDEGDDTPPASSVSSSSDDDDNTAAVCDRFTQLVADFTMSDAESAAAFRRLASEADDAALAAAIRAVGDGFARGDASISSDRVLAHC